MRWGSESWAQDAKFGDERGKRGRTTKKWSKASPSMIVELEEGTICWAKLRGA